MSGRRFGDEAPSQDPRGQTPQRRGRCAAVTSYLQLLHENAVSRPELAASTAMLITDVLYCRITSWRPPGGTQVLAATGGTWPSPLCGIEDRCKDLQYVNRAPRPQRADVSKSRMVHDHHKLRQPAQKRVTVRQASSSEREMAAPAPYVRTYIAVRAASRSCVGQRPNIEY